MPAYRRNKTSPWRFRKWVRLPDGRRIRIHGGPTTNTKKAAEAAEREAIEDLLNPVAAEQRRKERNATNTSAPTLSEYKSKFIDGATRDKPTALKAKNQILDAYLVPRFGHMALDAIRQHDVDLFVADLLSGAAAIRQSKKKTGLSRKTVNNITAVLGSVLKYAHRNGEIERPGLTLFMKAPEAELFALPPESLLKLLEACDDMRYRVAILLANDCGMRVGELRGLTWSDIDEVGRRVSISQAFDSDGNLGAPKTWRQRVVPISERLWNALEDLKPTGTREAGFVLTKLESSDALSYWAVRDKLCNLYRDAEGVSRPAQPWHALRHAFCTTLAASGVEVSIIQALAGHKSVETTMRYIHVNDQQKRDAISKSFGCNLGAVSSQKRKKPSN